MMLTIDKYLSALMAFTPCGKAGTSSSGDYICLIHVPVEGPERVYSIGLEGPRATLTFAKYKQTVWEYLKFCDTRGCEVTPQVDVLRASFSSDHPVFGFLEKEELELCCNRSDGQPGLEYYMLVWRRGGKSAVSECWAPSERDDWPWLSVIGALQAVTSQFEFAASSHGMATAH